MLAELGSPYAIHLKLASSEDDAAGLDLIACDSPYLERVIERASPVDVGKVKLRVATVEDLLLLKLDGCVVRSGRSALLRRLREVNVERDREARSQVVHRLSPTAAQSA